MHQQTLPAGHEGVGSGQVRIVGEGVEQEGGGACEVGVEHGALLGGRQGGEDAVRVGVEDGGGAEQAWLGVGKPVGAGQQTPSDVGVVRAEGLRPGLERRVGIAACGGRVAARDLDAGEGVERGGHVGMGRPQHRLATLEGAQEHGAGLIQAVSHFRHPGQRVERLERGEVVRSQRGLAHRERRLQPFRGGVDAALPDVEHAQVVQRAAGERLVGRGDDGEGARVGALGLGEVALLGEEEAQQVEVGGHLQRLGAVRGRVDGDGLFEALPCSVPLARLLEEHTQACRCDGHVRVAGAQRLLGGHGRLVVRARAGKVAAE